MHKTNINREKDPFSEAIKDKLTNYSLPVDDDSWERIEERLNPVFRRKTQGRWIAAIAAAACFALLFLSYPLIKKTHQHETANQLSNHEETIIQNVPGKGTGQSVLSPGVVEPSKILRKSKPLGQLTENNLATEVIPTEKITEENQSLPEKEASNSTAAENHPVSVGSPFDFEKETQQPAIKRKKRQSLRLSFGSGGNLLAENNTNSIIYTNVPSTTLASPEWVYLRVASLMAADSKTNDILSYENYPDIKYHLPLSFGITIKKELNRTFAIESGIVYSFLETSFSRNTPKSTAELQLHYIGIPLNLHTHIVGNRFSRWEVYLAVGGMIEKGVLSHLVQKNFFSDSNSSVESTTLNENINGLQWSVSAAPGIDYQIYKNYSIYLEPKVSYYFDNNQPVSERTKHPVVIGINAGIRYTW